jgi:hypothetical protein
MSPQRERQLRELDRRARLKLGDQEALKRKIARVVEMADEEERIELEILIPGFREQQANKGWYEI